MKRLESVVGKVAGAREAVDRRTRAWCAAVRSRLADTRGQGTTEYAILVGVLVVIAIIAITLFRPKLQELWAAIASGFTRHFSRLFPNRSSSETSRSPCIHLSAKKTTAASSIFSTSRS